MKNLIVVVVLVLAAYWMFRQQKGQEALQAYQARDAQELQAGSVCLPVKVSDGRSGWSFNLNLVLEQGKGSVFNAQAECEAAYQSTTGRSAKR